VLTVALKNSDLAPSEPRREERREILSIRRREICVGPVGTQGMYNWCGWEKNYCFGRIAPQIAIISMVVLPFWSSYNLTGGSDMMGKASPNWVRKIFNCLDLGSLCEDRGCVLKRVQLLPSPLELGRFRNCSTKQLLNDNDNGDWTCSPMVGRSCGMLPFPWFSRIYRRYALSGKRRSRRRRCAIGDFGNLQIYRCSVLRKCS
jgi:hypothetical protein